MDELLWARVIASFLVDGSLAVMCGLLLSSVWMGGSNQAGALVPVRKGLGLFAGVLLLGGLLQLLLLTVSFSGERSLRALMRVLPDVCGMHVGVMMTGLCVAAAALCAMSWVHPVGLRHWLCGPMVVGCIGLRGSTGHAAVDGLLSFTEGLQWVHLLGMAVWSGGVVVSGLIVAPEWTRRVAVDEDLLWPLKEYLGRLSLASTWAVGMVLVSGVVKSYRATEGNFGALRSSQWGVLLVAKSSVVFVTILLGARNRWLLGSDRRWDASAMGRVTRTLRVEAIAMLLVLLLSAWLGNSPPPLE